MLGNSLQNKKIIISAGASGIGWAIAKVCLSRGATVYLCDIDNKSVSKLNKHPLKNKRLFAYECDASDEYEVSNFFNQIKKKTKKVNVNESVELRKKWQIWGNGGGFKDLTEKQETC